MGYGDDIMATGLARGAAGRGKRIAFGDGQRIIWGPHSAEIFRDNPNIATELKGPIEWINYYKGNRLYNRMSRDGQRWEWNYEFRPRPGEFFWPSPARRFGDRVVIEPNVPNKAGAINKRWPLARYQAVADELNRQGFLVVQPSYGGEHKLRDVRLVVTPTFRDVARLLASSELYIGPEGGLHHAAAAVETGAVVLFGGFIPPQVTGYSSHRNLTGGASDYCGSLLPCTHCAEAMRAIMIDEVLDAAKRELEKIREGSAARSDGAQRVL